MAYQSDSAGQDSTFSVRISENKLEATIKVAAPSAEGEYATVYAAKKSLEAAGVKFGIDERVLTEIFSDQLFDREIVVARGTPSIDGKDAQIKYFFDINTKPKPKEDEKGNVDYKDINILQNVKKNQPLAELIPPEPGKEGMAVTGEKILPAVGKMRKLPSGVNTEITPDNPNILIASTNGHVYLKGGSLIQVDPVFVVSGHIDYKTGNIDYIGALTIRGNVKSGFSVKTKSDLEILGVVEDANITAGGNVLIKNGFLGKGDGLITAEGNVILKFCENQKITAKGDIIVGEAVLNSVLKTDSRVEVTGKKGVIVGGMVFAKKGVSIKELGNYQENKTEVIVGIDEELMKKTEEIEVEFQKNEENIESIKKAIYRLLKKKMKNKHLPDEQAKLLVKLQKLQEILPAQRQQTEKQREEIEEELKKYEHVSVTVAAKVYPGVRIRIQKYNKIITKEMNGATFKVKNGEIQAV